MANKPVTKNINTVEVKYDHLGRPIQPVETIIDFGWEGAD